MALLEVPIVQAFVDGERGGNPAGVVLDAERFDPATKQLIAQQVGVSETAFVSPSQRVDRKLEFWTPTRQIAHCGHATIATFSYLLQQGLFQSEQSSNETIDGDFHIFVRDNAVYMEQRAPQYTSLDTQDPPVTTLEVLEALTLGVDALLEGYKPLVINTGNNCLLVPLNSEQDVLALQPNLEAIEAISEQLDLVLFYVFSPQTKINGRHAGARMFAPRYGIPEESATGMAAGPLGCFLYDYLGIKHSSYQIEQGHLMNPPAPSVLHVELQLQDEHIQRVLVGGIGVCSHRVQVKLPA